MMLTKSTQAIRPVASSRRSAVFVLSSTTSGGKTVSGGKTTSGTASIRKTTSGGKTTSSPRVASVQDCELSFFLPHSLDLA